LTFAAAALSGFLVAERASAETITLRWRYAAHERAAGYRVHIGSAPGRYERSIDVGRPTPDADGVLRARVEVEDGVRSYLAVSAYDSAGRESAPSGEWARLSSRGAPRAPGRPEVVAP
jgi:hypothetical protein